MSQFEGNQSRLQPTLADNPQSANNQLIQLNTLLTSVAEGQARMAQQQDYLEHRMSEAERRFR